MQCIVFRNGMHQQAKLCLHYIILAHPVPQIPIHPTITSHSSHPKISIPSSLSPLTMISVGLTGIKTSAYVLIWNWQYQASEGDQTRQAESVWSRRWVLFLNSILFLYFKFHSGLMFKSTSLKSVPCRCLFSHFAQFCIFQLTIYIYLYMATAYCLYVLYTHSTFDHTNISIDSCNFSMCCVSIMISFIVCISLFNTNASHFVTTAGVLIISV